jgi:N-acetylglucosaminyldiphosphoundecaprenol N-acetyl-beta-D-mannosaminyltransferase
MMKKRFILGYPVYVAPLENFIESLDAGLKQGQHQHVVTLNPEMLMRGEDDPTFGAILKSAEIVLPDGAGIVWALRRKERDVQRIPGIDFSEKLIAKAASEGLPIALIGASPNVNTAARIRLETLYPELKICYAHHGFFSDPTERQQVAEACAASSPRYVLVALGVPGQECWIREFRGLFKQPTAFIGVGGSFDIWSGLKQRANPIFLKLNLEWLYRITTEPFRLKRVYKTLPLFVIKVLLHDNIAVNHPPNV